MALVVMAKVASDWNFPAFNTKRWGHPKFRITREPSPRRKFVPLTKRMAFIQKLTSIPFVKRSRQEEYDVVDHVPIPVWFVLNDQICLIDEFKNTTLQLRTYFNLEQSYL